MKVEIEGWTCEEFEKHRTCDIVHDYYDWPSRGRGMAITYFFDGVIQTQGSGLVPAAVVDFLLKGRQ